MRPTAFGAQSSPIAETRERYWPPPESLDTGRVLSGTGKADIEMSLSGLPGLQERTVSDGQQPARTAGEDCQPSPATSQARQRGLPAMAESQDRQAGPHGWSAARTAGDDCRRWPPARTARGDCQRWPPARVPERTPTIAPSQDGQRGMPGVATSGDGHPPAMDIRQDCQRRCWR